MESTDTLQRFVTAQAVNYNDALAEITHGKKTTHWMWYVFPQIAGLGNSDMAKRYAIKDLAEAEAYLKHPVLGERLITISKAMLALNGNDPYAVLGSPDDMKLHSSMTLFTLVPGSHPVFDAVLTKYYNGQKDERTLQIIGR
jgi:uncharacterized protein (DUF1810 family)